MTDDEAERPIRVRAWVSGRVQGVGFRYFVEAEASTRNLKGYVRNLPDGRVEMDLEGETAAVEEVIARVRIGPPGSRVSGVEIDRGVYEGRYADFSIRY